MVLDYLSNTLQLRCKANAESSLLVMLSCSPQCIIFDDTKIQKFPEICKYLDHYFCLKSSKKGTKESDPFAPFSGIITLRYSAIRVGYWKIREGYLFTDNTQNRSQGVLLVRFPQPLYIAAWETNENTPTN